MTDQERIAALEHEIHTLKADLAGLAGQLTLVKAKVDQKVSKPVVRGGQPVFG